MKFGAATSIQEPFGGNTALHCAIHSKNRVVVNLLVTSGASLDIPNNKVSSPHDYFLFQNSVLY